MSNRNYNPTNVPTFNAAGSSKTIRAEFQRIGEGFAGLEAEVDAKGRGLEWIDPSLSVAYISPNQFMYIGAHLTATLMQYRRVRTTDNGVYFYSEVVSSSYSGANTVVTLLDDILTDQLTLVEYALIVPASNPASSLSLSDMTAVILSSLSEEISLLTSMIDSVNYKVTALIEGMVPHEISTASGDIVQTLPGVATPPNVSITRVSYIKTSDDSHTVSFVAPSGATLSETGVELGVKGARVTFDKVGDIWYVS